MFGDSIVKMSANSMYQWGTYPVFPNLHEKYVCDAYGFLNG